jgi:hypothetical protein
MTEQTKTASDQQPESQASSKSPTQTEDAQQNTVEHSRKAALSKREIMEQLSRERFPWEE